MVKSFDKSKVTDKSHKTIVYYSYFKVADNREVSGIIYTKIYYLYFKVNIRFIKFYFEKQ